MSWTSADIAFKRLLNKRQTSSAKNFYEEFGDYTINVYSEEIWFDHVPSDASSLADVVQWYNLLTLINDPTVPSSLTWTAVTDPSTAFSFGLADDPTNPRLKDWISDKFGAGYDLQLFANGVQIGKADSATPWIFNYATGELTFNTAAPATPIQIKAYRYIGKKGAAGIFLKEVSLGSGFYWDASGFLDVSAGNGDVTKVYVDGSLFLRDVSIDWLNINKVNNASLGLYVQKTGDTMSGNLTINASLNINYNYLSGSPFKIDVSTVNRINFNPLLTPGSAGTAYIFDTADTLIAGDYIFELNNRGISVFYVDYQGATYGKSFNAYSSATNYAALNLNDIKIVTLGGNIRLLMNPVIADSSSAVAYMLDTDSSLTTYGAKLFLVRNASIDKFYIDASGNAYANGILLGNGDVTKAYVDTSLNQRLKEASLGSTFLWTSGVLDVSLPGGVTQVYVDNADNNIKALYIPNSSLNQFKFAWIGNFLEPSIVSVSQSYIDGSLATLNASVNLALTYYYTRTQVDSSFALKTDVKVYDGTFTADGSSSEFTISHNMNTLKQVITTWDSSSGEIIYPEVIRGLNANKIKFYITPSQYTEFGVIIMGF